jgi:hypothetical protein
MSNYGPPQIFPPVPVNIPGSEAPVTLVDGVPVFVPTNAAPALATGTVGPLTSPLSSDPFFVPPIVLEVDPDTTG